MANSKLQEDHDGGGAHEATGMMRWLLTYADLITLLLIVFIVMYAYSRVDKTKFQEATQSFNHVFGTGRGQAGGGGILKNNRPRKVPNTKALAPSKFGVPQNEIRQMNSIKKKFDTAFNNSGQTASQQSNISTTMTERGLVISFTGQVLFERGKADIKPEMLPILSKVIDIVKSTTNPVRVEGFTDDIPIKTAQFGSNWELSTARATSVLRIFVERGGLPPGRFSAAGYGQYKPTYPNSNDYNRALNRKVDVILLYEALSVQEPADKGVREQ